MSVNFFGQLVTLGPRRMTAQITVGAAVNLRATIHTNSREQGCLLHYRNSSTNVTFLTRSDMKEFRVMSWFTRSATLVTDVKN